MGNKRGGVLAFRRKAKLVLNPPATGVAEVSGHSYIFPVRFPEFATGGVQ